MVKIRLLTSSELILQTSTAKPPWSRRLRRDGAMARFQRREPIGNRNGLVRTIPAQSLQYSTNHEARFWPPVASLWSW